ncbi:MAG TPA: S41 family peptidase [Rhodocyclaceae bacterium]|nr:S41 family peptidase [Rhodocyclaceae bacterium]
MHRWRALAAGLVLGGLMAGCGGGGGGGGSRSTMFTPESQLAQQCAPDNPYVADASGTTTIGSLVTEKSWMRSYFDSAYLWYDQVPTVDANAAAYSGPMTDLDYYGVPLPLSNYFEALKTTQTTASGALRDRFSFTYPTKAWNDLSQSGVTAGYGIEWAYISSSAPRSWRVAIVQAGSPAAAAGLQRGDTLLQVDGVDFVNGTDTDTLNNGLLPVSGTTHTLVLSRAGSATNITASMTASDSVVINPVPIVEVITTATGKVGYLHFTDHIASSETMLISAISAFQAQGVTDLVLDMRYNGGGYLYIASELAYMIAGPTRVSGKYFEKLQYNAKRTADNTRSPTPFYNTSCILNASYNCTNEQPLPTLNLGRVFVIAQGDTCSASEAVINGLNGIDVNVILIGGTTCGKPYGFTARDNCGVSYFPIEFMGTNYKGFGDYADGFTPVTANAGGANLPGCPTVDDFAHSLGDTSEQMLATALQQRVDGTCLTPVASATGASPATRLAVRQGQSAAGSVARWSPRQGRVLLPRTSGR